MSDKILYYGLVFLKRIAKAVFLIFVLAILLGVIFGIIEYFRHNINVVKTIGIILLSLGLLFGIGTLIEKFESKQ